MGKSPDNRTAPLRWRTEEELCIIGTERMEMGEPKSLLFCRWGSGLVFAASSACMSAASRGDAAGHVRGNGCEVPENTPTLHSKERQNNSASPNEE